MADDSYDPNWDPPRTPADIYDKLESALWAEDGYPTVEAHNDGLLIVASDGREWWLTARDEDAATRDGTPSTWEPSASLRESVRDSGWRQHWRDLAQPRTGTPDGAVDGATSDARLRIALLDEIDRLHEFIESYAAHADEVGWRSTADAFRACLRGEEADDV